MLAGSPPCGAPSAAAVLRGLSDEQVATDGLILHLDDHFGNIRKTVGH